MARLPRLFVPGYPQLLLQRSINHLPLFRVDEDRSFYLDALRESARESGVLIHAYVLMPDHVHLLLTAPDETSASSLMQRLGRRYVRYYNDRYQRTGTLWEGRFRSMSLEPDEWLLACYVYVETNPVRTGLVADARDYAWSSCAHHLGLLSQPLLMDHRGFWALGNTPFDRQAAYFDLIEAGLSEAQLASIRYAGHHGWALPCRNNMLSANRRSAPLAKGRPRRLS